jgi:hypothetical protein
MGAAEVVVGHPGIQDLLGVVERVEAAAGQQLGSQGLVEPLDLAGGGGGTDPGEQVGDPLLAADAVEQHLAGVGPRRPVKTLPLSVKSSSGLPWRSKAAQNTRQTALALARSTSPAATQNREWSSMPVTALSSWPSVSQIPPMMSSCHSSIGRLRSQRR